MAALDLTRVPVYYHKYIAKVEETDLAKAFMSHGKELVSVLKEIPADKWNYRYAPGKWSIKELVQHLIDAERIFAYRALRFARKDTTPLPGFEENDYAANSEADRRTPESLLNELQLVQESSAAMFNSFSEAQLEQAGTANDQSVYVRAIGFIMIGHTIHHLSVMKERYLQDYLVAKASA
jgi:uncharacterized damage-inducible protein DinB